MKLVTLNLWGGKVYKPLLKFIKENNRKIDIFCFQEMFQSSENKFSNGIKTNLYDDFSRIFKDYVGFFAPTFTGYDTQEKVDFDLSFGQATFIKKNIELISEKTSFVHGKFDYKPPVTIPGIKDGLDLPRNIHCLKVKVNNKELLIGNLHGYWLPDSKNDTPGSIRQMRKVKKIFSSFPGPKILAGDFNLRPDTKSIKMLEEDMINLIIEYGVTNTRSNLHKREEKFADYIMVSDKVRVNNFEVIDKHVSDHLPLLLDFSV
ncbi:MAG: endonuclease/exonuclease/phosphatase family protein [Candidatus Levybacteria bacterium]|nr:endonuclease/exonuclease/phosphatase family protein [Candidatus Levybacteria bacterium]